MSIEYLCKLADDFEVRNIANIVLENPDFAIWSGAGSPDKHHYGKGGLLKHTTEVIDLCLRNNSYFGNDKKVDDRKLFLAGLFHDVGKIHDYAPSDKDYKEWHSVDHKYKIYHISRSVLVWHDAIKDTVFSDIEDEVTHAILAHHGRREWGSPVECKTRLAWLLHLCDSISARMDDCDRIGKK